jgi:hypothetical protein
VSYVVSLCLQARIKLLEKSFRQAHPPSAVPRSDLEAQRMKRMQPHPEASLVEQGRLLFARSWREVARNKAAIAIQASQQVTTALIYGGIYSLGDSQKSIQDRLGLLSLVAIGNTNLALAGSSHIPLFLVRRILARSPLPAVLTVWK